MLVVLFLLACSLLFAQAPDLPHALPDGYALPNGWRITPIGKAIPTEDMVLNVSIAPDGRAAVALHGGFNPHGLVVIDTKTGAAVQRIVLKSAWLGLAWSADGKRLFVSGGNANHGRTPTVAPIYVFDYANGKLSDKPVAEWTDPEIDLSKIYWSGLVHHPSKPLLYAANRGTAANPTEVVVFDTNTGKPVGHIPVEINPYALVLSADARYLYVSNWSSNSVSVIDAVAMRQIAVIPVDANPNDMQLGADGRLYVACSNENTVVVIDTKTRLVTEKIATTMFPRAPEGSTPDALALDREGHRLYIANADNNNIAVVDVTKAGRSEVLGFIPSGWYPSALALSADRKTLYCGNSKGTASYADIRGPHSPLPPGPEGNGSVKSLQKGSVNIIELANWKSELKAWTKRVYENTPYTDKLLAEARAGKTDSVIPRTVGEGSPIHHVLYIIKENRTYDQVLGDLAQGNGDARLTIFGRKVTPNHHALAEEFVLLDNLYCDGEVSVDGHSWSNSAYATDFNEKLWPVTYGSHSRANPSNAYVPSAGHLWDLCKRKGLTYRSYGEYASRVSDGTTMDAAPGVGGLVGHVSPAFKRPGQRDTVNAAEFLKEFEEYEKNFDSKDAEKRLPNFMVMSLAEDHTVGTVPGRPTPVAMVASNDYAVGMIVERLTKSKYWPELAIFIIEDDAQDGADHVDARRTVGLAISPYIRRKTVDSTLYTTSSFLRSIELLLGLPPMSQYDAAAMPLYASFATQPDLSGYTVRQPEVNLNELNTAKSYGAKRSKQLDFSDVDLADARELNEILWRSVKGAKAPVPVPVHAFHEEIPAR